ncbi:uncharacterized protein [Periplaneta americana]|uniref:uncharacterized protein isoform X3 n=1 Tax=Periplaneta americana TaxID=6978 RepID=UPI0037E76D6F
MIAYFLFIYFFTTLLFIYLLQQKILMSTARTNILLLTMCARCEYSLFGRNGGGRNPDHYWSPCSNGAVPPGATVCGRDKDGSDLYVGRVLYEGDMLPAKVSPSHGGAFFSHGGAEHSCANYEVHPSHKVCYIPYAGQELSFQSYEVLVSK